MKRTSITDFAQDRDWTPPPTNKVALDVTLGAGDSVSIGPRPIEESVVVHIGIVYTRHLGEQLLAHSRCETQGKVTA